jgi:hypothetical protein
MREEKTQMEREGDTRRLIFFANSGASEPIN